MSKGLWWTAGAVVFVVWLASPKSDRTESYQSSSPSAPYGHVRGYVGNNEDTEDEANDARREFEDAASELRIAVDDLRISRWEGQMSTIRDRLDEADEALVRLELLRPGSSAVINARAELETMRGHMNRLHFENWRLVRPDLETSSSAIEDEATAVETED